MILVAILRILDPDTARLHMENAISVISPLQIKLSANKTSLKPQSDPPSIIEARWPRFLRIRVAHSPDLRLLPRSSRKKMSIAV